MMARAKTVVGENSQQCMMIQGMFGLPKQATPITIDVTITYSEGVIKCDLEVIPSGDFVVYRVVDKNGAGLYHCWNSPEEVEQWFKAMSLLRTKKVGTKR